MQEFFIDPDITKAKTIHTDFYTGDQNYLASKEKIFAPSWQFVGDVDKIAQPGSAFPFLLLENYLNEHHHFGINISISDERDEVLETGGGLKKAAWFFNDQQAFLVMNVDILTQMNLQKMMQFHAKEKPLATLAVSDRKSSRCFLFNDQQVLCGWKNKNTGETKMSLSSDMLFEKSFSGIHIIEPHIFSWMHQTGKFSIVDV